MWAKAKGWLILLGALSVPAAFAAIFIISQREADKQVAELQKFQKEHPTIQEITVDNYELKEIGLGNLVTWKLRAKKGTLQPETKDVKLSQVGVLYYDETGAKVKMSLTAPVGIANEETHLVKLESTKGNPVKAEGAEGAASLMAPKVELTKKNQFIASGGVTIVYPGVAKVTGSTVTGSLSGAADLKNFKIVGNTHALIGHM